MASVLENIRILDLSRFIAGPYCSMLLGDMGADVVKIETPGKGELARNYEPQVDGQSLYTMVFNRNKRGLTINLRSPEGQDLLRELVKEADVLVENFRPGTLEKMGCGWDVLSEINPRLILARISGFGQTGPYAQKPCFDVIAQSMSGLMDVTGDPDGPPTVIGTYVCDYVTAMYATIGILGAIEARHTTGRGQVVDVSLLDSAVSMLTTAIPERLMLDRKMTRRGNRDPYGPPTASYKTGDGDWVYIACGSLFPRFAKAIGREDLLEDERFATFAARGGHTKELEAIAAEWIAERSTTEVLETLEREDVPCTKIASIDDVVENPQLAHRNQIVNVPTKTGRDVPMQGVTIHLSETPLSIRTGLPDVGGDSAEILSDWLGYSEGRVERLKSEGFI